MKPRVIIICALAAVICRTQEKIGAKLESTPGVVTTNLGKVSFLQDFITVKLDLRPVSKLKEVLIKAKHEVENLLDRQDQKSIQPETLKLLQAEKKRLDMMFQSRKKRSLFPFGGDILQSVLGTATETQVHEVKMRYKELEKWAKIKGTLITKSVERLNQHSDKIKGMSEDIQTLSSLLNSHSLKLVKNEINEMSLSVATYLSFMIEQYEIIVNAIVLASKNIVSPNLFSPSEFRKILDDANLSFRFKSLFDGDRINDYYALLHTKIIDDDMYIFIPFASAVSFNLYHFVPFPSYINDSFVVELDIDETFVLINVDFTSIAKTSDAHFKKYCIAAFTQNYLCPANKFHFFPATNFDCLLNLAVHSDTTKTCKFRHVKDNTELSVYHSHDYNYIFSVNQIKISILCGGEPQLKTFKGNVAIKDICGVSAPNLLKIYPSHSHAADATAALPSFSSINLRQLSIPEQARNVVVHHFKEEEKIQNKELTWGDLVDVYHPYVSYVATPLVLVIMVIVLIGTGRLLYKKKVSSIIARLKFIRGEIHSESPHPAPAGSQETSLPGAVGTSTPI